MRIPFLESFPHGLVASHMYSPACLLLTLVNTSGFSEKRLLVLTSSQETDGIGIPVTIQYNVAFLPSTFVTFSSCSMADRSENEIQILIY